MRIWLDDLRPAPNGYVWVRSVNETIAMIEKAEAAGEEVELLNLDHDLGDYYLEGGDAIKVLDYLVERQIFYPTHIHTANLVGRANMERVINRY